MDDTTVKLLQKGKGKNKARTAWFWVYARDGRAWSGAAPPAVWYQFSTSRGAEHPPEHLEAYEGFAQADAYAGYNDAHRTGRVRLSGNTWPMGFEYIGSQPKDDFTMPASGLLPCVLYFGSAYRWMGFIDIDEHWGPQTETFERLKMKLAAKC